MDQAIHDMEESTLNNARKHHIAFGRSFSEHTYMSGAAVI